MKVLIISTNRHPLPVPVMPIGACIVAEAAESAGHTVKVVDLMFKKNPLQSVELALDDIKPDVIGLSVRNIDNNDMQNPVFFVKDLIPLIETVRRKSEATIILGGSAASVMPEELMRYTGISCAVLGDGEVVFPELLRRLSNGGNVKEAPGVALIDGDEFVSHPRLSGGPSHECIVPDFARWIDVREYLSQLSTVPLQTKLGCHFKCIYCTYRKIEGNTYRLFDPEGITELIKRLASSGLRDIEFVDNVFNSPYYHAAALCENLARERVRVRLYSLELNPLLIDDTLITVMERAGFRSIGITVESASDEVLHGLRKGYTAGDVHRAAQVVRNHKLPCVWIFMLGGPCETEATVRKTLRFAEKFIRPHDTAFFGIGVRVYPGTELETIARQQGVLSLSSEEMFTPVFYVSPEIDSKWMSQQITYSVNNHMNFISSVSIGLSFLPSLHRLAHRLGIKPPLWKYTRFIRRGLRFAGIDA